MVIKIPAHRLYHKANWDEFTKILEDSHMNIIVTRWYRKSEEGKTQSRWVLAPALAAVVTYIGAGLNLKCLNIQFESWDLRIKCL